MPLLLLARGAAAAAARRQVLNYVPRLSAANRGLWGIMREMDYGPRGCARVFNRYAAGLGWGHRMTEGTIAHTHSSQPRPHDTNPCQRAPLDEMREI